MEFIAEDEKSKKIKKLAFMLKKLDVNIYIYGEKGVGKTFLAEFISNQNDLIIENFDKQKEFIKTNKRIIAIGKSSLNENLKEKYNIDTEIFLDSLKNRPKDTEEFIKYFSNQVKKEFNIEYDFIPNIDIKENLYSLKKSIYKSALNTEITKETLINYIELFFKNNEISYNEALKIFDEGIIKAFAHKYPSKLQMAKAMKINRGTLTKKMEELNL